MSKLHSPIRTLAAGLAGAMAVNVVHELTRHAADGNPPPSRVPRLDRLGQEGLAKMMKAVGLTRPPPGAPRYAAAMVGDVATNTLLYALTASIFRKPLVGGAVASVAAGAAGLLLPQLVGMQRHTGTKPIVKAMTFADYALGGIVTGMVLHLLTSRR